MFQWVTNPMGLLGCMASSKHLMETLVNCISNIITYIENLLLNYVIHKEHQSHPGQSAATFSAAQHQNEPPK
jgi:hypothetical protein